MINFIKQIFVGTARVVKVVYENPHSLFVIIPFIVVFGWSMSPHFTKLKNEKNLLQCELKKEAIFKKKQKYKSDLEKAIYNGSYINEKNDEVKIYIVAKLEKDKRKLEKELKDNKNTLLSKINKLEKQNNDLKIANKSIQDRLVAIQDTINSTLSEHEKTQAIQKQIHVKLDYPKDVFSLVQNKLFLVDNKKYIFDRVTENITLFRNDIEICAIYKEKK